MPTDIVNTITELNILFQDVVLAILGYTKSGSPALYSDEAYSAVRIGWPTEGAPAWKITDDVCFLRLSEEDDTINRQREETYEDTVNGVNEGVSYTRVIGLNVIFYGPNSFRDAQNVRDGFFHDEYRRIIAQSNMYLIPDIISPRRAPEEFGGMWWERVDLDMRFNEKILKNREIGYIESAEVVIYDRTGLVAEIEIQET